MTTTSILPLVIALGTIPLATGCSIIKTAAGTEARPSLDLEPALIPEKPGVGKGPLVSNPSKEEVKKADAQTALDIAEANPERPYMSPPVIPGVDPEKPILPNPKEASKIADGTSLKVPSKPEEPKVPPSPKSMIRGKDGLYYATGFEKPFSGLSRVRLPNGSLYEGGFKNGMPDGSGVQWNKAGNKKYEGLWRAGQLFTGKVYYYYPETDKIKLEGQYLEGRIVDGHGLNRTGQRY